jgi:hypothetical protein
MSTIDFGQKSPARIEAIANNSHRQKGQPIADMVWLS